MVGGIVKTGVIVFAGAAVIFSQGCATSAKRHLKGLTEANKPQPISSEPVYQPPVVEEGSLWRSDAANLFDDARARHVGDTVTLDIVEVTSSKLDANTSTGRTSSIDSGVDSALGYMRGLEAINKNLGKDVTGAQTTRLFKADMSNKFDGKGSSDRSGSITASIGARVVKVLPDGNLVIYGRRDMKVNNEVQCITASGIVRPKDIDSDNRIKSTYLAEARIEYVGQGVLANEQHPGWASRVLNWVWPF